MTQQLSFVFQLPGLPPIRKVTVEVDKLGELLVIERTSTVGFGEKITNIQSADSERDANFLAAIWRSKKMPPTKLMLKMLEN